MALLQTVDLEQRAGAAVLLNRVSLSVEKGEIFAVIGPTGAGKTTLLRLINLLDHPSAGDIYFDGEKITDPSCNAIQVRRRMAMVFQKPAVFNSTVYENVAYPLKVRGHHGKTDRSTVYDLLDIIGLRGYAKRKAKTLSGGEAQRVALARAVVIKPDLLLLDEPTANLDPGTVKMIERLVMEFNRDRGLTVIMSTHDMQQAQRVAHRVGVLMNGQLVQVGRPHDIFYSPDNARIAGFVGMRNLLKGNIVRVTNQELLWWMLTAKISRPSLICPPDRLWKSTFGLKTLCCQHCNPMAARATTCAARSGRFPQTVRYALLLRIAVSLLKCW